MKTWKKTEWYLAVSLLILLLIDMYLIKKAMPEEFNSDTATAILLAREQLRTGQWMPDGWHYANDIWVLSLNLFCIPFMLICKDWLLCRELAVAFQTFLTAWMIYGFGKKIADSKSGLLMAILFFCPLSITTKEHLLFQATYTTGTLQTLLVLLSTIPFLESEKRKETIFWGIGSGILYVLMTIGGVRFLGATAAPLIGAEIFLMLFACDFDWREWREKKNLVKLAKLLYLLLMCGIGYLCHLKIRSAGAISEYSMKVINAEQFWSKLSDVLRYYLTLWGCFDAHQMMTVGGILGFFKLLLLLTMAVIAPVYMLIRYRYIKTRSGRLFVLYSVFSWIIINYLLLFTEMCLDYYLLPIFFNDCVLSAMMIQDLYTTKKNLAWNLSLICAVPFCLVMSFSQSRYEYDDGAQEYALIEFLKSHDLHFGASGNHWDAYKHTVLSNGEVEIVAFIETPERPQLWLSSDSWYEPTYYEGRTFILEFPGWSDIPEYWRDLAEETYVVEKWIVYVYPENIFQMAASGKAVDPNGGN